MSVIGEPLALVCVSIFWFLWFLWACLDPWATSRPVPDLRFLNDLPVTDLAHSCGSILIFLLGGLLFLALGIALLNWWFNRPRHPIY